MRWNPGTRLIVADVDDTIAEVFRPATQEMITALERLMQNGVVFFLISGQRLSNVFQRLLLPIDPALRKQVLVASCNGAEVHVFDAQGSIVEQAVFSATWNRDREVDHGIWRGLVNEQVAKFDLTALPPMGIDAFMVASGGNPRAVMLDDRNVQISLDFVNWIFSPPPEDIRPFLIEEANRAFRQAGLDVAGKTAGDIAIDFSLLGVDKGLPLRGFIAWGPEFRNELPHRIVLERPSDVEVWGDRFSALQGGADLAMASALPPGSRKISFRDLPLEEASSCAGLCVWRGKHSLQAGLLEYLTTSDSEQKVRDE
jgi:hypothetical protein